jgi:hypothetical protein
MDFPLALPDPRNIVESLHPHERFHFHSEGFLDAERHASPGRPALPFGKLDSAGRETCGAIAAAAATDSPAGWIISARIIEKRERLAEIACRIGGKAFRRVICAEYISHPCGRNFVFSPAPTVA